MRIARFYQKTLFGVFALMGLIVASTSALYVYTVDRQLTGDFLKNSRAIARSIANSNIDLIVHQNYSALQSIIDQFVAISGISYVFVAAARSPPELRLAFLVPRGARLAAGPLPGQASARAHRRGGRDRPDDPLGFRPGGVSMRAQHRAPNRWLIATMCTVLQLCLGTV